MLLIALPLRSSCLARVFAYAVDFHGVYCAVVY